MKNSPVAWVFKSRLTRQKYLLIGIIKENYTKTYYAEKSDTESGALVEVLILILAIAGYVYLKVH